MTTPLYGISAKWNGGITFGGSYYDYQKCLPSACEGIAQRKSFSTSMTKSRSTNGAGATFTDTVGVQPGELDFGTITAANASPGYYAKATSLVTETWTDTLYPKSHTLGQGTRVFLRLTITINPTDLGTCNYYTNNPSNFLKIAEGENYLTVQLYCSRSGRLYFKNKENKKSRSDSSDFPAFIGTAFPLEFDVLATASGCTCGQSGVNIGDEVEGSAIITVRSDTKGASFKSASGFGYQ